MSVFALVDCNNFYVSCERVFAPSLENRPVAVLSNNDGCIVARSNEVKNAGIPMGAPYFKYRKELEAIGAVIFSSNYALYGDMSARVMSLLQQECEQLEIYSIDEAFLKLDGIPKSEIGHFCAKLRQKILQCTGIPVSIGIAATKTLAKLANEAAKKDARQGPNLYGGVVNLVDLPEEKLTALLSRTEVGDVWGVGHKYSKILERNGVKLAADLILKDRNWIKKNMTIQGLRLVNELNGISCYNLEQTPDPKRAIASTRSFGRPISDLDSLKQAITGYCTRIGEKLRYGRQTASSLHLFLLTDRFKSEYCWATQSIALSSQTNYTPDLIKTALGLLERLYQPKLEYKKAGVIVTGLTSQETAATSLFAEPDPDKERREAIMQVTDLINKKYGRNYIRPAQLDFGDKKWHMSRKLVSPRYTTVWREILEVS